MNKQRSASPDWHLQVLGVPMLQQGALAVRPGRKKSLAMLVYLAVTRRTCSREMLAAWFWPDLSETGARTALRSALADIGKVLGKGWNNTAVGSVGLNPELSLQLDLQLMQQALKGSRPLSIEQIAGWQGEMLQGFSLEDCDLFEEWLYFQRESARHDWMTLISHQLRLALEDGNWQRTEDLAKLWLARDSCAEAAHMALMQCYAIQHNVPQALKQYSRLEQALAEELGVKPGQQADALKLAIERGQYPLPRPAEPTVAQSRPFMSDIRYACRDDVYLAYRQIGRDKPVLVIIWGFVSHLEQMTEQPALRDFFFRLAERFTLVLFDKRGMGLSDRIGRPPVLDETAADVIAIMQTEGIDKAWVAGVSEGGPAAIRCACLYPDRVCGLLLYGTAAKWTASADYPYSLPPHLYEKWLTFLENSWGTAVNLQHFAPGAGDDEQLVRWWSKTLRMACSPGAIRHVLEVAKDVDVRDCLSSIHQPTLVVQQVGDQLTRVGNGRYLAEHIANACYIELPGQDHWLWVSDTSEFFKQLDSFLSKCF